MRKDYQFDKLSFIRGLIENSIRMSKRGSEAIERLYEGYRQLIKNQLIATPERSNEVQEMTKMLDRAYKMFSDEQVVQMITSNNITGKQFMKKYGEKILGDGKRKYRMADQYNPDLIAYASNEKKARKVQYMAKTGVENRYLDLENREVIIQEIGRLYFEEWNGVKNDISKYRIMRQISEKEYHLDEVFSNIRIIMMEDPEYREAVLEELLSANNIELSNAGGYIGEISEVTPEMRDARRGSEQTIAGNYMYKINDSFVLSYNSTDLSAIMLQGEKMQGEKNKEEKNKKVQGTLRERIAVGETPTLSNDARKGNSIQDDTRSANSIQNDTRKMEGKKDIKGESR